MSNEPDDEKLYPELKDLLLAIHRYNASHKDGCFLFRFIGFKKDFEHTCEDCGKPCDMFDETKSLLGAYGDLGTLRQMLNELRDAVEDEADEDLFVNI